MKTVTETHEQVLAFIAYHVEERGYPPTMREIASELGYASASTAHRYVSDLVTMGRLRRVPGHARQLTVVKQDVA